MTNKTFSQAPRIELCPASQVLPHTRQAEPGEFAIYGNVLHAYLRDVNLLGAEAALEKVPVTHREAMAVIDLSKLPMVDPAQFVPEIAVAWDPETGEARELHRGTDTRDYSTVPDGWWAGTADLAGLTDTHVVIWDYKSGWKALASPDAHLQLLGYAVALSTVWRRDKAWVGFVRLPEGGEPRFVFAELEMWDLDVAAERLRDIDADVEEAQSVYDNEEAKLKLVEGEHCTYCPAFNRCPAKAKLLNSLVVEADAIQPTDDTIVGLTPEIFPAVLKRWELATKLLARVKVSLNQYAGEKQIPLGNGEVFGQVATAREASIDLARAGAVVGAYGKEVLEAAVERTEKITKTSLKDALRPWVEKRDAGKAKKEKLGITRAFSNLEDELRKAGAMKPTTTISFTRHKPKPLPPDQQPEIKQIAPPATSPDTSYRDASDALLAAVGASRNLPRSREPGEDDDQP